MTEPKWVTRQLIEFIYEAVIEIGGGAHGCGTPPCSNLP